ncbi:head decoration protein [Chromobacterium haemolyticum]|uniref:head decoration protein n=1 Tax=Chromobacterium haemolyticum TaxID=394935 RepID=UPI001746C9EF|nr:head decoration protein [Chromobacterium haemolyticum]QOD84177.1 head decoration protein [Chromobacterium haemolyticum]
MSKSKVQALRAGEFLLSVGNGGISMEKIVLAAGSAFPAGQVLAFNAKTKEHDKYDPANADLKKAVGILYAPESERLEPAPAAMVARQAEVVAAQLTGLDDAATAALAAQFIVMR